MDAGLLLAFKCRYKFSVVSRQETVNVSRDVDVSRDDA